MKMNEAFPSDYFKTDDVSGKGEAYTIKGVTSVEFEDPKTKEKETKRVVWFEEIEKGLILNKTNWQRIFKLLGIDDDSNWKGHTITLVLEEVEAFGKSVDAIRVKA